MGKELLPSDQSRRIEQGRFTYSLLDKTFEKQRKSIEDWKTIEKQWKTIS